MINGIDVSNSLKGISTDEAEIIASEVNLLASKYGIQEHEIKNMLSMDVDQLTSHIELVKAQRQDLKMKLRKQILKE
jgi:hypothetical protein